MESGMLFQPQILCISWNKLPMGVGGSRGYRSWDWAMPVSGGKAKALGAPGPGLPNTSSSAAASVPVSPGLGWARGKPMGGEGGSGGGGGRRRASGASEEVEGLGEATAGSAEAEEEALGV